MRCNFGKVEKAFEKAKRTYEELRETERKELSKYLVDNIENKLELRVTRGGSAGKCQDNYTSGGRIEEYDLRNWKWFELKGKGTDSSFSCFISLNMHEVDPHSANVNICIMPIPIFYFAEKYKEIKSMRKGIQDH